MKVQMSAPRNVCKKNVNGWNKVHVTEILKNRKEVVEEIVAAYPEETVSMKRSRIIKSGGCC